MIGVFSNWMNNFPCADETFMINECPDVLWEQAAKLDIFGDDIKRVMRLVTMRLRDLSR